MGKKNAKIVTPARPKRPSGVWALTAYSLLSAGLLPALISINSIITKDENVGIYTILFNMLLGLTVILLSVGTWQGRDTARRLYLIAMSLHYVLIMINNVLLLRSGLSASGETSTLWQQILLSAGLLVTNWVYFNLRWIKAFYQTPTV